MEYLEVCVIVWYLGASEQKLRKTFYVLKVMGLFGRVVFFRCLHTEMLNPKP